MQRGIVGSPIFQLDLNCDNMKLKGQRYDSVTSCATSFLFLLFHPVFYQGMIKV